MTRELIAVTNTTVVNTETMCELLLKIANALGLDWTDHTRAGQRSISTQRRGQDASRKSWGSPCMFLLSYSPNLNLIERLWKFVKRRNALYGRYHPTDSQHKVSSRHRRDARRTFDHQR